MQLTEQDALRKDAAFDGDLGFTIHMGDERFNTNTQYSDADKSKMQAIVDFHDRELDGPSEK